MHSKLFNKYFTLCFYTIFISIIIIGSILFVITTNNLKNERIDTLSVTTKSLAIYTENDFSSNEGVNAEELTEVYKEHLKAIGADFTLVDNRGLVIICTEKPCIHKQTAVSQDILKQVSTDGFCEFGNLNGIYQEKMCISAYPLSIDGERYYLFSAIPYDMIFSLQISIIKTLVVLSIIVFIFVFIVLYIGTRGLITPLSDMADVAKRIGKGDFSKKLTIESKDEIGFLANSLNEMSSSLENLENMRRSFIANVSHELKTPMTTISGFINGILDKTIPPEKEKYYLRIISDEVDRLSRLVKSMLNIAKIEAREMELSLEKFDVTKLVLKSIFTFEKQIDGKNIDIRGLDISNVRVQADSDLIHQVIYNLIENAVKFVNENGYIEFSYRTDGGRTFISIKNSGDGLTQEEISRVFDRFYKTDLSRGKDKNGVGLGLYIVKSIINLHEGDLMVKSVVGEYTEFEFSLKSDKVKI